MQTDQDQSPAGIDYLADWPTHYYDIPAGAERIRYLDAAAAQGIEDPADIYRRKLCEKRFFSINNTGSADAFMRAWMMIQVASNSGTSFIQRKRQQRQLEEFMRDLCLLDYEPENEAEQDALAAEWQDFAGRFLSACTGSKSYRSTLFGLVPINDAAVAEKIALEIIQVTRDYPAQFGLAEAFTPLSSIMKQLFCRTVPNGAGYFDITGL